MALIQVHRIVAIYFWPISNGLMDTAPHHLIHVTSFAFSILLLSFGLVLMASDQPRSEFEHLATHDPLTNALTRRHTNEICQRELERVRRNGRTVALLLIDLDHFKAVNDSFGHQVGDRVLVDFVAKVRAPLRQPDQPGRYGGEEFLVLLPETSQDEALDVANRIREACTVQDRTPVCTASIGVATNKGAADAVDGMLARTDAALYRAKANGRNRVETG